MFAASQLNDELTCLMLNAYVDLWDMPNKFCFHVYAQKSVFIGENGNGFFLPPPPHPHP